MDVQRGLDAHMERARRNGCSPEGVERCGVLWLNMLVRKLENAVAVRQAEEIRATLPVLAGKAVTDADRLEVLDLTLSLLRIHAGLKEQVVLDPKNRANSLEGKAFAGLAREKRRALRRLIEDIGGYAPDGGYAGDLLDFDPPHVERALELTRGEVEPDGEDEETALARWRERVGESP